MNELFIQKNTKYQRNIRNLLAFPEVHSLQYSTNTSVFPASQRVF